MHRLRLIVTALALLAWLPASVHCLIAAAVPSVPSCAAHCHDHEEPGAPVAPGECHECLVLESAQTTPAPVLALKCPIFSEDVWLSQIAEASLQADELAPVWTPRELPDPPPPLSTFVAHTALPVRGPSLLA